MNEVLKTIKTRRSVRSYKDEQIKKEELDLILEAAIYAPSAHNKQPWHFTVIQNRELIDYISSKTKELMAESDERWIRCMGLSQKFHLTYEAPTLIIVSGKNDSITWQADCSAAMENILIAAESLNIGSVWLGFLAFYFSLQEEVQKLNIPEGYTPYYGIALGYKKNLTGMKEPKRNFSVVDYIR